MVKNAGKSSDFRTWYQFFHPQAECCVEFSGKRFRISKSELVFSQPLYLRLYKVVQRLTENQVRFRNPESFSRKPSAMSAETGSCTSHSGVTVLGSIPGPKREETGKTGAPCVKVPGSSRVPVRDGQTSALRPRLVVSRSTCPPLSPSPHANSFVIGTAVINKHTLRRLVCASGPCR